MSPPLLSPLLRPLLILASRLERHAWTHGALVARLSRALADRGTPVTLLCDAAEDIDMFGCRVSARRPFEHNQAEQPAPLARWLRQHAESTVDGHPQSQAMTLSLTRLAAGEIWMPLDQSVESLLEDELGARSLLSRAMWFSRHWGALAARAIEREAAQKDDRVRRVLAFGPTAAAAAARRWVHLGGRVRDIGFTAMADPIAPHQEQQLRAQVRARLHINPSRRVVLVSLMRTVGEDWDAFLAAVARTSAPEVRAGKAPVIIAMARDAYAAHNAACAAGCQRALRIVGQTAHVHALLAASDAAAAPLAARPDPFRAGATGRFIADALRAGRPVLAAAAAAGADLLDHRGVESPGAIIKPTTDEWANALHSVCDDDWLAARSINARAAGRALGFEDWLQRILAELEPATSH